LTEDRVPKAAGLLGPFGRAIGKPERSRFLTSWRWFPSQGQLLPNLVKGEGLPITRLEPGRTQRASDQG